MKDVSRKDSILTDSHNLLHWEQPVTFLGKILRVYPEEIKLLLWVTVIQMVMRISSILINNYAQAAFIKRYGVESLPTIFVLEAVLTFFFASAVGFFMGRHRTMRVFTGLFLFFACSMGLIRMLIPLGNPLVYPVLYILKSQSVEILPILYWDILTDLFTTQQSKRLYTLITAGGVLGTTLGSLMTGKVAHWVGVDNLLLIFIAGMILSAFLNELTEKVVGAPMETRTDRKRRTGHRAFKEAFREFVAFSRESLLLRYLILIIAIPNILLPIITYQFNVVVDDYYATESATLQFFGLFRGISNATMFFILLFSGRLITRWGVATTLLIHPINYLISFGAIFLQFDLFTGIYSRFSSETIKTTLNNPARAVLFNFFPEKVRGFVRVFIRGHVVRAADFAGSGLLMLIRGMMDPRLLSLVAAPLAVLWIVINIRLKRRYPSMLIQTLMEKRIDLETLEDMDFKAWVSDRRTMKHLQQGLRAENPDVVITSAQILARMQPPGWSRSIAEAVPGKTVDVQKGLLDLLRPQEIDQIRDTLLSMARNAQPNTLVPLISALSRLDPKTGLPDFKTWIDHPDPRVVLEAMVGLYRNGSPEALDEFRRHLQGLMDGDQEDRELAIEILGRTGDPAFSEFLLRCAKDGKDHHRAWALSGLGRMKHEQAMEIALRSLSDVSSQVREAALEVMTIFVEKAPPEKLIGLLEDEDPAIRKKASVAIRQAGDGMIHPLFLALASPSRSLRNEVLSLLGDLDPSPGDMFQFIRQRLEQAYQRVADVHRLKSHEGIRSISFLMTHLLERNDETLEVVLRVLGVLEYRDRMKVILRAIQSKQRKDMDTAIEALESSLHPQIRNILIPLLEERPLDEKLAIGKKRLGKDFSVLEEPEKILLRLLDEDPVSQAIALYGLREFPLGEPVKEIISRHLKSESRVVMEAAEWSTRGANEGRANGPNLIERINGLKKIPIFRDLRVQELMAVASVTQVRRYPEREMVVQEGAPGDALFLIWEGTLSVIKGIGTDKEILLDRIKKDDFFGEMALIDHETRSATVRAESDTILLVISGGDFTRIMVDYPAIPMMICKILSQRIRILQRRLTGRE